MLDIIYNLREFAFANERRPDSGAVKEVRDATSDPHFFLSAPKAHRYCCRAIGAQISTN